MRNLTDATATGHTDRPAMRAVGVGPWQGPWPEDERYDEELLANGDARNVVDRYRYWRHDAIVADLDGRRHPFHIAIENWQHDLNIGSVVRTANAFCATAVHIVGRRRWNRRGAMVTDRYQRIDHHPTVEVFAGWATAADLPLIGLENLPGSTALEAAGLPESCVLVFGQEGPGLSGEMAAACQQTLAISQFGSTRSINVAAAAAIAMHAWIQQHAALPPDGAPPPVGVSPVQPCGAGADPWAPSRVSPVLIGFPMTTGETCP